MTKVHRRVKSVPSGTFNGNNRPTPSRGEGAILGIIPQQVL